MDQAAVNVTADLLGTASHLLFLKQVHMLLFRSGREF